MALKKNGRPISGGGQQPKENKASTLKTTKKKIEEIKAMEEYLDESISNGEKGFGVKWKDFEVETFITIRREMDKNL